MMTASLNREWLISGVPCLHGIWYLEGNLQCEEAANQSIHHINSDLEAFSVWYSAFHGYVSLLVCFAGILLNLFNVMVLTRKHMQTPVNNILTGLAISDIITMLSYVPFAIYFYCVHPPEVSTSEKNNIYWMNFLLFHVNLTTVTHNISIWLCVSLSILRYIHIKRPSRARSKRIARIQQSKYLVALTYLLSIIIMIPNFLTNELKSLKLVDSTENSTIYVLKSLNLGTNDTRLLVLINVFMYAVIGKLIPCCLMGVFGSMLVHQMQKHVTRRRRTIRTLSESGGARNQEHSRTTVMLISVILLFIITELPQGLLIMISACKQGFFDTVYLPLGDIMDIVALLNNAINFVLYCSMSSKFRETFLNLFCNVPKLCQKCNFRRQIVYM